MITALVSPLLLAQNFSAEGLARRSCERRAVDFGGCRCQAFLLTGNAAATDPACSLSPDHGLIESARAEALAGRPAEFTYRMMKAGT